MIGGRLARNLPGAVPNSQPLLLSDEFQPVDVPIAAIKIETARSRSTTRRGWVVVLVVVVVVIMVVIVVVVVVGWQR